MNLTPEVISSLAEIAASRNVTILVTAEGSITIAPARSEMARIPKTDAERAKEYRRRRELVASRHGDRDAIPAEKPDCVTEASRNVTENVTHEPEASRNVTENVTHGNFPSPSLPPSPTPPTPRPPTPTHVARAYAREPDWLPLDAPPDGSAPRPTKNFSPPTYEDWFAYGRSLNPPMPALECESSFAHYEAKGWIIGKTKARDWKACLRTCYAHWKKQPGSPPHRVAMRNGSAPNHGSAVNLEEYA